MKFRIPGIYARERFFSSEEVAKKIGQALYLLEKARVRYETRIIIPSNLGIDAIFWNFATILYERVAVPISGESTEHEREAIQLALKDFYYASPLAVTGEGATLPGVSEGFFLSTSTEPAAIIFTSGSSGAPKGVVLSRKNIFTSIKRHAELHGENAEDLWLCNLPLNHVGGFSIPWRAFFLGQDIAYEEKFEIESALYWMRSGKITHISMVPTMLHRILKSSQPLVESRLKAILLGGAPASEALLLAAEKAKLPILTTYGMTETCSQIITSPYQFPRKIEDGVGVADSKIIRLSSAGEIQIHKDYVAQGYINSGEEFIELPLSQEFFSTGDLGHIDAHGNLHVLGRKDDLIISGGVNIFPREIEELLQKHEAIENCCVVGLPDAEWGQKLAAAIQWRQGWVHSPAPDLREYLREKLSSKKIPKDFLSVETIPATKNGKIIRHKVAELFKKHSHGEAN